MGEHAAATAVTGVVWRGPSKEPVFVLCCARSGSTLLRFLLDAHPDLVCPPESSLPWLCEQLAKVWAAVEGVSPEDRTPPPAVLAGVRETVDAMVGPLLAGRGKTRYCDKSLGSAYHADALVRTFPDVKFLCLYRHPMDMVASGLEACQYGFVDFGFQPYVAACASNTVLALARYWMDHATVITAVEERYPRRCHRVRYEDLVTAPEQTMDTVFRFLGAPSAPGVSERCFKPKEERAGRGDNKIWDTREVVPTSVGRGWQVPATILPEPARRRMAALTAKLGYVPVGDDWGKGDRPADLRGSVSQISGQAQPAALVAGAKELTPSLESPPVATVTARPREGRGSTVAVGDMKVTRLDFSVPIMCIDDFLEPGDAEAFLTECIDLRDSYQPAEVVSREGKGVVNPSFRANDVVYMDTVFREDPERSAILRAIARKTAAPECRELWATGGLIFDVINYATKREAILSRYSNGGFFKKHTDTLKHNPTYRLATIVYYAHKQPGHFTGGDIVFHTGGDSMPVEPKHNRAVVFPSSTLHEVKPIAMESSQWDHGRFSLNYFIGFQ